MPRGGTLFGRLKTTTRASENSRCQGAGKEISGDADVVVLGAGAAGLAAAIALGSRATVLERSGTVGGLGGSLEIAGAIFDVGGHTFHTPHPEVRDLVFGALAMVEQKREARCHVAGSLIDYPFQKYFRQLNDRAIVSECEEALAESEGSELEAGNLESYFNSRFGKGIARHFLVPYNTKLWGTRIDRLTCAWAGERVAAPHGIAERFQSSGGERKPLQDDTTVAYPARGGFGAILKALAAKVEILRLCAPVTKIDPASRTLSVAGTGALCWQQLITTLALPELLPLVAGVPEEMMKRVRQLEFLSSRLVFVVVDHPVDSDIQRIYSAGPGMASHKIVISHASSPYLRSLPRHGVMGEISFSAEKPLAAIDHQRAFVQDLIELGVIRDESVVFSTALLDVRYAYPLPVLGQEALIRPVLEWLRERGIHSVGRFGEWAYINSDEAIHRGLRIGRLLSGH